MTSININKDNMTTSSESGGKKANDKGDGKGLEKKIKSFADVDAWKRSQGYRKIKAFLAFVSEAMCGVKGISASFEENMPKSVENILCSLDSLSNWIKDFPPTQQATRFGNKAYRDWFSRLEERIEQAVEMMLQDYTNNYNHDMNQIKIELGGYILESFGNNIRIDYGTGHELSFMLFLICLMDYQLIDPSLQTKSSVSSSILIIFHRYISLVQQLQTVYKMEPAGSCGVWGLDDYQFLPFLWGSYQHSNDDQTNLALLRDRDKCAQIHSQNKYDLFFMASAYALKAKNGPFFEHSPVLFDISRATSWMKVNRGLERMYNDAVLHKFPVIQHVKFGSTISIDPYPPLPSK